MTQSYIGALLLCIALLPHQSTLSQIKHDHMYFTSDQNVDPLDVKISETKTIFDSDEDIYAFVISTESIENILPNAQRHFYIQTSALPALQDIRFTTSSQWVNPVATYYIFPILLHQKEKVNHAQNAFTVMQHLSELPTGQHTITVKLKEAGNAIYTADFMLKVQNKLNDLSAVPEINPNQREKGYLEFGMKQSDYEKAILERFTTAYPAQGFKRVVITSDNFINQRKSNGRILSRTLQADIIAKRGGKCRAYDTTILQKKVGTDFGVFEIKTIRGYYPISCKDAR